MDAMSNSSTTDNEDSYYSKEFVIGTVVCLTVAAFVGLIGNGLIVIMITNARKLRSVMNRFILHLAIGDLIVCAICIPLFLAINFYFQKNNQEWICKLARFLQYLAPQGSMMLLITIGINRHRAIVHPLRSTTYGSANRLIIGAWLYSLIVVSPSLYLTNVRYYTDPSTNITEPYCATIPVSTELGLLYVLALAVLGYFIPLTALVVLYAKISYAVWRRENKNDPEMRTSQPAEARLKSRKKVIKMFLTVIVVFMITWLPLIIYVGGLERYLYETVPRISRVRLIVYSIGLSNSIYNPFIYSFFNKRFREGCKGIFRRSFLLIRNPGIKREVMKDSPPTGRHDVFYARNAMRSRMDPKFSQDQKWQGRYSPETVRGYNEEAFIIDSKHNVKLLDFKNKSNDEHTESNRAGSDPINGSNQQNCGLSHSQDIIAGQNTDGKQSSTIDITTEISPTPLQSRPGGRTRRTDKKKLFKTFSERPLEFHRNSDGKTPQKPKLRKVESAFTPGTASKFIEDDIDSLF